MTSPAAAALGPLARAGRLWRTVRWLKATQVIGRVRFRLSRGTPDLRPPPPRRKAFAAGPWVAPPARAPSLTAATTQSFLAEAHDLDEVGWDDPALPLLWRYNQHYFDDLAAAGAIERRAWHAALIDRWIAQNPPGRGTAWAPYPTSLRIVNWVKAAKDWGNGGAPSGRSKFDDRWVESLAVQARWLTQRLEWHLLGNHLFVNAKALVFAGLLFEGGEADRWLATGLDILERELPEQILDDGAQFELSPMYHVLALEDVLDLLNAFAAAGVPTGNAAADGAAAGSAGALPASAGPLARAAAFVPALRHHATGMLAWLRCLRHPDGTLARFNDVAEGIAPPTGDVERYAAALGVRAPAPGEGARHLPASGYVRLARGPALALLDIARIGPDYLPGHAHADTLSFELSVHRQALVVNRGTSVYGEGARRQVERGTAAHSTVQLAGHDSSEVWAGFRVGRRARPLDVVVDGFEVRAAHDGYAHLPGGPVHRRAWRLDPQELQVEDEIAPASREPAVARFHLAPGLACEAQTDGSWLVLRGTQPQARARVDVGSASLEEWQHAQGFGRLVPALTLAVRLAEAPGGAAAGAQRAVVRWTWADAPGGLPP